MKFSVSNIALPSFDHERELNHLAEMGISGVEVAPSRIWRDTWKGLRKDDVEVYRRSVQAAGLEIVGLHSLLFDHPNLGLFADKEFENLSLDFLAHLSKVCRDLGGSTLIYGGGRNRGDCPYDEAIDRTISFMKRLLDKTEGHDTCFCFEPLGPSDCDFINSALESLAIVEAVNHPRLAVQLDAKALAENNEMTMDIFSAVSTQLVHFHANEPGLGVLGSSSTIDHHLMGRLLRDVGYSNYVSIEQRMLNKTEPLVDIQSSVQVLIECYAENLTSGSRVNEA